MILILIVAGCSQKSVAKPKSSHPHHHSKPVQIKHKENTQFSISKKPVDGALASIKQIKTASVGSGVKMYKLFYWSNGNKVEAFLTEPKNAGKYPLLVCLHGGAAWRGVGHSSFGYTAKEVEYNSNDHTIMLYPEYEGYMDSQGSVWGMKRDFVDVKNAIKTVTSMGEVKSNDTYVIGYSLGGGLALMTAAQDQNVKAVVGVSPFVGLIDFMKWAKGNAKPGTILYSQMHRIKNSYGNNVNSSTYKERSPNINDIQAPILLLQGTADKHVAWQTVKTFANQMKSAHKKVKLVLYKNGQHGLHSQPFQSESSQQIHNWFYLYGLNYFQ